MTGKNILLPYVDSHAHLLSEFYNDIDLVISEASLNDVKIIIKDPEIFDVRYTGKFRQRDGIDEILRILQKIRKFDIKRDRDNNIITLTR